MEEPGPGEQRALSIRDIARLGGVSRQTVSRVLNGERYIKPSTEAQVRKVIEEHSWRPNSAARALATARSRTIGLLVSARSHYGPFSAATAIDEAARNRGYAILSATLAREDGRAPRVWNDFGPARLRSAAISSCGFLIWISQPSS